MRLYALREVQRAFGVDHNTLMKWLRRLQITPVKDETVDRRRRLLTDEQVELVARTFGRMAALPTLRSPGPASGAESPAAEPTTTPAGTVGQDTGEASAPVPSELQTPLDLVAELTAALLAVSEAEQLLLGAAQRAPRDVAAGVPSLVGAAHRLAAAQQHLAALLGAGEVAAEPVQTILPELAAAIRNGLATVLQLAEYIERTDVSADTRPLRDVVSQAKTDTAAQPEAPDER